MRISPFMLIAVLLAGGCATSHPDATTAQISQKRVEFEVLRSELDLAVRQLQTLQDSLATNSTYSPAAQSRDLDDSILVVRQACDRLTAEYRRLHDDFHVYDGRY